ncbi:hybrid sensor histidine kinase/response regulator [Desulfuromonas versatilis]|uniref:histidine kinase n=1 Tax=Desulfuromonas versatilis TaxID=2802975 RepID=A0ABN6E3P5_9BACT|nr:response regulator [Desulfuromonas versatilis]BCR06963.1 hybrid sensor histidine kinase/response regulator [Desulfuromonas versatilis]
MNAEEFVATFLQDAEEHIRAMRGDLLALEKNGSQPETVREIQRRAHNLKGSARVFGLEEVGQAAHALEDLLAPLEKGGERPAQALIDQLLAAVDELERRISLAQERGEILDNLTSILTTINGHPPSGGEMETGGSEPATATVRTSTVRLDRLANQLGELLGVKGRFESLSRQLAEVSEDLEAFLGPLRRTPHHEAGKGVLGELQRLCQQIEGETAGFAQLARELRGQALALRMRPFSSICGEFPMLVRDLAREQGKQLELVIRGEEVELDRALLEALRPMLVHMLRNAVDHGIESPADRQRAGKNPGGRIDLTARYQAGMVMVFLRDDGRGIDPQAVRQAAVRRRLVSAEEAAALTDREALYLVLRPGFSTRELITDVSGRGVGLDVVKTSLDQVKGNLELHSTPGQGTEIVLKLPLTLAVVAGLVADCEGEAFVFPLHFVSQVVRLGEGDLLSEGGREVIRHQGRFVPLLALHEVLKIPPRRHASLAGRMTAIILNFGGQALACAVSGTLGTAELLVKPLGPQLKNLRLVSGATLLGDGSPALLLSIPGLYAARQEAPGGSLRRELKARQEPSVRGRVLVVDDSITTRTMEKNILESHRYQVEVAINGQEALGKTAERDFDLVVTDIEMPGMDGFELTRALRSQPRTAEIPVVIVTSRASDEDRRRGIEVGAQAYIVKSRFEEGKLLDAVEALIG